MKRKTFLTALAVAGAAGVSHAGVPETPALVHHVFFWLKNPDSGEDRAVLIAGLKKMAAIPQVKKLEIGLPASTEKRTVVDNSWQVSELMYFDTTNDQAIYQEHPAHKAFVESCSHLWSKVVVYDMQII